jgi:ABC-type polysaccharide/polyol phosphate transport system ATPase subunit
VTNVIEVEHVYKQYQTQGLKVRTLVQDIGRRLRKVETQTASQSRAVLQDINFTVKQGESVGIIGSNGSGKTTLLRLLAGISLPTKGRVRVQGHVAPLLALGAGFHYELTGRENLYLNCTLMGLGYRKTLQTIDSIVEFAEVGQYIDIAVKRYSSGMIARLGFAAAIHTEPDIILLDEVLAVGDHNFVVKSFAALRKFMGEGRTVILVSHGLSSIEAVCSRAIWIEQSIMRADGASAQVVEQYTTYQKQLSGFHQPTAPVVAATPETEASKRAPVSAQRNQYDPDVNITPPQIYDASGNEASTFAAGDTVHVRCHTTFSKPKDDVRIVMGLIDLKTGAVVSVGDNRLLEEPIHFSGDQIIECIFQNLQVQLGAFGVYVEISGAETLMPMLHWRDLGARFFMSDEAGEARPALDDSLAGAQVSMRYIGTSLREPT